MGGGKRVLYISGFNRRTTARELAEEFERYGPVNRCDIPGVDTRDRFGFLEYELAEDAEEAYRKMHEKRLRCGVIRVEWAKKLPRSWREEDESRGIRRRRSISRGRSRSRSPARSVSPRRGRSRSRSRSPSPMDAGSRSKSPIANGGSVSRSPSPSRSPVRSPGAE